jgi:hypothetical protein
VESKSQKCTWLSLSHTDEDRLRADPRSATDMDSGDVSGGFGEERVLKPRTLPDDLPKSLDDRKSVPSYTTETEMYDAWQGDTNQSCKIGPAND